MVVQFLFVKLYNSLCSMKLLLYKCVIVYVCRAFSGFVTFHPQLKTMMLRYKKRMQHKAKVLEKKHILDQTVPEDEKPDWWPGNISRSNEHMDKTMSRKMKDIRKKGWGGFV